MIARFCHDSFDIFYPGPRVGLCVGEGDETMRIGKVGSDIGLLRGGEDEIGVEYHRLEEGQAARRQQVVYVGVGDVTQEVGDRGSVQLLCHSGRDFRGVPENVAHYRIVEDVGDV